MRVERTTISNESVDLGSEHQIDVEGYTVTVTDKAGEVIAEQKVASVVFSGLTKEEDDGNSYAASLIGEYSTKTIIESLNAVMDVIIPSLKSHANISATDYMELMSVLVQEGFERHFSKEEQAQAIVEGMLKMAKSVQK